MNQSTAPKQSFSWLRPFLPKKLQPYLRGIRKRWQMRNLQLEDPYKTVFPYTQASKSRQENLVRLCKQIEKLNTTGAIVECGVLDGGTAGLMAITTSKSNREIHLFDAWLGLPKTTIEDGEDSKKWVGEVVGSPKRVVALMKELEIDLTRINFHTGWFHETFPKINIPKIALLHIDCDFYEPTKLCLDKWYPHIVSGGFIQFDDYSEFEGCQKAVDEFLINHPELTLQTFGEGGVAFYIQKP